MIEKNKFFRLLKLILTISLLGYAMYIVIHRLKDLTLFNVSLAIIVLLGSVAVIFGMLRETRTKSISPNMNMVFFLNFLCGACLLLIVVSTKTDLIELSKQAHTILFILSTVLFAISTAIKFFERKKLKKT